LSTDEQPLPNPDREYLPRHQYSSSQPATMSSGKRSFFAPKKKAANPFDSGSDDDKPQRQQRPAARASSVPPPDEQQRGGSSLFGGAGGDRAGLFASSTNHHYRNDFRDAGGLESQSVQELEGYAAYKAEETTRRTQGCVRIAEEMRDTASKTLVTVHQQGQQIHRTHMMAVDIDQDLSRVTTAFSNFFC
jgi:synaptosomal-associated protein 25